jgi:hypothetical protein
MPQTLHTIPPEISIFYPSLYGGFPAVFGGYRVACLIFGAALVELTEKVGFSVKYVLTGF